MKGQILDAQVHVEPSEALLKFIRSLDDCDTMPENVLRIFEGHGGKKSSKKIQDEFIPKKVLTAKEREILKNVSETDDLAAAFKKIPIAFDKSDDEEEDAEIDNKENIASKANSKSKSNTNKKADSKNSKPQKSQLVNINDLRWLDIILEKRRSTEGSEIYLHELLEDCKLVLPKNEIIPRNPVLEARCVKLREEQNEREYRKMTKDVDATRQHMPEETIAFQVKAINRQLIAVAQFVMSVIAGFAFGFIGLELMVGELDFGFRLFMGVMCALIIALAEIYFLAKKLNEYDQVIDEPQVPIPPRRPDQHNLHQHQD